MAGKTAVNQAMSEKRRAKWAEPEYRAMMLNSPNRKRAFSDIAEMGRAVSVMRVRGKERPDTPKATAHPSVRDIAWAAGFIEGEGHFRPRSQVTAVQVDMEPLARLASLFGGSIVPHTREENKHGWQASWTWRASGARARGIALTLFPLLSARRQAQIRRMIAHVG